MSKKDLILFGGRTGVALAGRIAELLGSLLGRCTVERFPDGEINVRLEESVSGHEVYLIQSTCPPVNDSLFELLCLADACRRSSALLVTAVVPYFGYARSGQAAQPTHPHRCEHGGGIDGDGGHRPPGHRRLACRAD